MKPSSSLLFAGSAVLFAALGIAACSSDSDDKTGATGGDGGASSSSSSSSGGAATYTCTSKGACPKEPAPTQEEIDACKQLLAGPCAKEYQAYGDCSLQKEVCASDGTHDDDATKTACNTTWVEFSGCITTKLAGDAGTDDGGST